MTLPSGMHRREPSASSMGRWAPSQVAWREPLAKLNRPLRRYPPSTARALPGPGPHATTLPGRNPGEGYGLTVRVISDFGAAGTAISNGSFGWSGAFGTHFWVDPRDEVVAVLMIQTPIREMRPAFENAVMQAIN